MTTRAPFPYPVLGNSDDVSGSFNPSMRYSIKPDYNELYCNFEVTNDYIRRQIQNGNISYVVEVKCGSTNYRNTFQTCDNEFVVKIPSDSLREKVQIEFLLCASRDLLDYLPDGQHVSFDNEPSFIASGEVIGLGGITSFISDKEFDPLRAPVRSFIKLLSPVPDNKQSGMEVEYDNEYIGIRLCKKDYTIYRQIEKDFSTALHAAIVLPVLIDALYELNNKEKSNFANSIWANRLREICRARSIDMRDPFRAAQQLLGDPINRMLEQRKDEKETEC